MHTALKPRRHEHGGNRGPLLTLGLLLDGSRFVRRSQVFDGKVVEGTTLEGMLHALGAPAGALGGHGSRDTTEEKVAWLRARGYRYTSYRHHLTFLEYLKPQCKQ